MSPPTYGAVTVHEPFTVFTNPLVERSRTFWRKKRHDTVHAVHVSHKVAGRAFTHRSRPFTRTPFTKSPPPLRGGFGRAEPPQEAIN